MKKYIYLWPILLITACDIEDLIFADNPSKQTLSSECEESIEMSLQPDAKSYPRSLEVKFSLVSILERSEGILQNNLGAVMRCSDVKKIVPDGLWNKQDLLHPASGVTIGVALNLQEQENLSQGYTVETSHIYGLLTISTLQGFKTHKLSLLCRQPITIECSHMGNLAGTSQCMSYNLDLKNQLCGFDAEHFQHTASTGELNELLLFGSIRFDAKESRLRIVKIWQNRT